MVLVFWFCLEEIFQTMPHLSVSKEWNSNAYPLILDIWSVFFNDLVFCFENCFSHIAVDIIFFSFFRCNFNSNFLKWCPFIFLRKLSSYLSAFSYKINEVYYYTFPHRCCLSYLIILLSSLQPVQLSLSLPSILKHKLAEWTHMGLTNIEHKGNTVPSKIALLSIYLRTLY